MNNPESLKPLLPQQKESLIVLIAIHFAEYRDLLNADQIADARASLPSLFLQATGEETMLRKLIGILNVNRVLNRSFGAMAEVLDNIRRSSESLIAKHAVLREQVERVAIPPDAHVRYVGPLLEFSSNFLRAVTDFGRLMNDYRTARENEARTAHVFRVAQEARELLKERLERGLQNLTVDEERVRKKVIDSFDFAMAEADSRRACQSADQIRGQIDRCLKNFHFMCQMAMKPEMRNLAPFASPAPQPDHIDVYAVSAAGTVAYGELRELLPTIQELLRLYQRSYGLFMLDFDKFNRALKPMKDNPEVYFEARGHDEGVREKQRKLKQIESLIAFIESASLLLRDRIEYTYPRFSLAVSNRIAETPSPWEAIAETLLHMKVAAEAELTTRIG